MSYNASHIEVLEGLEGVRRRPGMYIGGTDLKALHHLVAEILDNATDEVVAGHANRIDVVLGQSGSVSVQDNGRGIPVDAHPRYPDTSALEIILTKLHAGGKFHNKAYTTSGGLNGVGISVVNALSKQTEVTVERDGFCWRQTFSKGIASSGLIQVGATRKRGTRVEFFPDPTIFPEITFNVDRILEMCRAKAYLNRGVRIHLTVEETGAIHEFHFPGGIKDYIDQWLTGKSFIIDKTFSGTVEQQAEAANPLRLEWAMAWTHDEKGKMLSYCNTIPTPEGGTHEAGLRAALLRGIREYAETRSLLPKGIAIIAEDVLEGMWAIISIFISEPEFSGQTKERLASAWVTRQVESAIKDHLDHWLHGDVEQATRLVTAIVDKAQDRQNRRKDQNAVKRKTATTRLTLPGKLTDCTVGDNTQSELFIVEGDSAGGSAKQARNRYNQAVLPLRGKILNVEQANLEKFEKNTEIQSLVTAIGTGCGKQFDLGSLRYGRIVIMTDADVDGAHIASLLLTFFFRFMTPLIQNGHLYLAQPPLYRLTCGAESWYALDDVEKEVLIAKIQKKKAKSGKAKIDQSRFKGLGEMDPKQLRETTMDPASRRLLRVFVDDSDLTHGTFNRLMGKKPLERFLFIQEKAPFAEGSLDI
ncbi:MAG: DNA topoisomerase IV subunit B [Magnetococcales bacterium]|nr:DNA topoisomerase IV subunit B [Magnetococcales bacterium]MBF0149073.1 DNA topoisomerase IV subunit B [Magnetococcales bacterium]